jgi:HAMP domain-containing protein
VFDGGSRKREKESVTVKLKSWFPWFCIIALLFGEVFLFSANRQKEAALVALRDARRQVEQLRTDLDQAKATGSQAQNAEFARLRSENQDLSRLRNEIRQLREVNQQLTQQLKAAHDVMQQQQGQLQQLQVENEQAKMQPPPAPAVPAVSAASAAQADARRYACLNNLRQIDAAKQQWALENEKTVDAIPTAQDLAPYLSGGIFPACPDGGIYTLNSVGDPPTCSISGHALPQ